MLHVSVICDHTQVFKMLKCVSTYLPTPFLLPPILLKNPIHSRLYLRFKLLILTNNYNNGNKL
jgi:hypothetical protein